MAYMKNKVYFGAGIFAVILAVVSVVAFTLM